MLPSPACRPADCGALTPGSVPGRIPLVMRAPLLKTKPCLGTYRCRSALKHLHDSRQQNNRSRRLVSEHPGHLPLKGSFATAPAAAAVRHPAIRRVPAKCCMSPIVGVTILRNPDHLLSTLASLSWVRGQIPSVTRPAVDHDPMCRFVGTPAQTRTDRKIGNLSRACDSGPGPGAGSSQRAGHPSSVAYLTALVPPAALRNRRVADDPGTRRNADVRGLARNGHQGLCVGDRGSRRVAHIGKSRPELLPAGGVTLW